MFKTSKLAALTAVASSVITVTAMLPVFAIQQSQYAAQDYTIQAFKNCALVYQQVMDQDQLDAYRALKHQQQKMHRVEADMQSIQGEMEQYTMEIERLTSLAIQETADALYIDKQLLKQQEESAQQLEAFMQEHQHVFTALGQQGALIGQYADAFSDAIQADLTGVEYDNVQIVEPGEYGDDNHCNTQYTDYM